MQCRGHSVLTTPAIEEIVMNWYRNKALACFSERIALYAGKLDVALPQLRLARARTQWAVAIRVALYSHWRLIQCRFIWWDYVVRIIIASHRDESLAGLLANGGARVSGYVAARTS